ncbi:MAG: glycosyltransferase family 2 protein [Candidatus Xenobia bacterium]
MRSTIGGSILVATLLLGSFSLSCQSNHLEWLHETVVVFTYYAVILLGVAVFASKRQGRRSDMYRPFVTCLVPARNEACVIEGTVRSLAAMGYRKNGRPNFEIIVLDDNSDDGTWDVLTRLTDEIPNLRIIHRGPDRAGTGKSAVLNEGLANSQGEIVAVFDGDSVVEPGFLRKTVPYLYDPKVGGVQGRVRIYNHDRNVLTALQEDEFAVLAHLTQIGKDRVEGVTCLGGNGQLTRRSILQEVGGWNVMSTTEDLDLSLRMLLMGSSIRYCGDAVVWQEGVETWKALIRQRARWAEGFIKSLFDYGWSMLFSPMSVVQRLDAVVSLTRILIPLWLWVAYLITGVYALFGIRYAPDLSGWFYVLASWGFFVVMTAGMYQQMDCSWLGAMIRVMRYWIYNSIWVVVVPIGFMNCMRNFNRIRWDKTHHGGSRMPTSPRPLRSAPETTVLPSDQAV